MKDRITLQKIKLVKSRSFETPCFSAVVCLDGVPIAHVNNDGIGCCCDYALEKGVSKEQYNQLVQLAVTLRPNEKFEQLDMVIYALLDQHETEQFHAKQMRKTEFCIVGQKGNEYITNQPFSKKIPIETLMKDVFYGKHVQKVVYEMEQKGWKVLNTNIPR